MPLARKAVTFSFCHTARSSRTTMSILVSNLTDEGYPAEYGWVLNAGAMMFLMAEWVRYLRSPDGSVEAMAAHFEKHVYHRHSHETYSFRVTDSGVQAFRCRGAERAGVRGTALVFNPDDPHDGHADGDDGFTYRIIHLQSDLVTSIVSDASVTPAGRHCFANRWCARKPSRISS